MSSDHKSYRNIRLYTTELPSTKSLQRNRFGGSLRKQGLTVDTSEATKNRTFTDVPGSWVQGAAEESRVRHTTHQFAEVTASTGSHHRTNRGSHDLRKTAKVRRGNESSKDCLVDPTSNSASIEINLSDYATVVPSNKRHRENDPAIERAKTLDVGDLTMVDWASVAQQNGIRELAPIGEGAGGIVMKCEVIGHKTVFAIKVGNLSLHANDSISFQDSASPRQCAT